MTFFQSSVCQDPKKILLEGLAKWKSDFLEEKWLIFRSLKRLLEPASGTSFLPEIRLKIFLPPVIDQTNSSLFCPKKGPDMGGTLSIDYRGPKIF